MSLLAEVGAVRRFFRLPREEREVVFYSEHEGYWPYLEGLVHALLDRDAAPFCYVTSDADDPVLRDAPDGVHTFHIETLRGLFTYLISSPVVVMTVPDLQQLDMKRSLTAPVHYVYVFHSLNSTHMAYRHGAFDHYDSVLCTGPYMVEEIRRAESLYDLDPKELVEAGYYRLERIYEAYRARGARASAERPPLVLVAPSWAAHNILESHGERLVERLLERYRVIVRPHPETVRRAPELIESLRQRFGGEAGFTLETSVATDDSLLEADALITDWSGIALEYAFGTERPVLYLDVPRKVHNERYHELGLEPLEARMRTRAGLVVGEDAIDEIDEAVAGLIADAGAWRDRLARLREEHVYVFGRSAEVGADHILAVLGRTRERAERARAVTRRE